MVMENCDIRHGKITHSISTVYVRVSVIQALFQLEQEIIGLKDTVTSMIVVISVPLHAVRTYIVSRDITLN